MRTSNGDCPMNDEYKSTIPQDPQKGSSLETDKPPLTHFHSGQRLLDRYDIFGYKKGGFGIVYFVEDFKTGWEYAVKTFKPEYLNDISSIEQFKSEVDFWVNLDPHPHIVKAHFVEIIDDQPYLFLDYVKGGAQATLRDWLSQSKPFDLGQAIVFFYQLCLGMEFANQRGEIAHLDLKPENILIDQEGILKITDFGLANHVQIQQGQYSRLSSGTWPYASPERFLNQVEDTRSDIYSVGVILYEMLTGELPYPFQLSNDPITHLKQLEDFHKRDGMYGVGNKIYWSGVAGYDDEVLSTLLSGCLTHDPSDRFRDFTLLLDLLVQRFDLSPIANAEPSEVDLHKQAQAMEKIGNYSKALSLYNELLERNPENANFWLETARVLRKNGQVKSAQSFLQRARDIDPALEQAWDNPTS